MKILAEYRFSSSLLVSIITIAMLIILMPSEAQTYSEPNGPGNSSLILNSIMSDSINPQFSASNNSIYAVWIGNLDPKNSEVLFKKTDLNSLSITTAMNISNMTGISNLVKLSTSEDNVYLAWEDKQTNKWNLLFSKSNDDGTKFSTVTNLSNATGNVHLHDLASVGNNVFVLWAANENTSSTNKEVFFIKSRDGGNSFSDVLNLSNDIDDSLDPHMVINQNGSIIYIVWTSCDSKHDDPICSIAFTRSLDQGITFAPTRIINVDRQYINAFNDTLFDSDSNMIPPYLLENSIEKERFNSINPIVYTTLEGKQIYVLWEQSTFGKGGSEIFLVQSNDYGNSFNLPINISNSSGTSRLAHGHIMDKELYVTWADTLKSGSFDVMLRKVSPNNQLGKVVNLSNNSGNSVSPYLWTDNNRIYVTWIDNTNGSSILLSALNPSGSIVTESITNSQMTDVYANPVIFDTNDKVWIAWTESNQETNKIVIVNQEKPR